MLLFVRTQKDPRGVVGPVEQLIHRLTPDLAIGEVRPMTDSVGRASGYARFITVLLTSFGLAAAACRAPRSAKPVVLAQRWKVADTAVAAGTFVVALLLRRCFRIASPTSRRSARR